MAKSTVTAVFVAPLRTTVNVTVPLVSQGGRYDFSLPLLNDRHPIPDLALSGRILPPCDVASLKMSSLPQMKFEARNDGSVSFHHALDNVHQPANWNITYQAPVEEQPTARVFSTKAQNDPKHDEQYFVMTVPAALNFLSRHSDCRIVLVGRQGDIEAALRNVSAEQREALRVQDASEVVEMSDPPAVALRSKRDSSMRVAVDLLRTGEAEAVFKQADLLLEESTPVLVL